MTVVEEGCQASSANPQKRFSIYQLRDVSEAQGLTQSRPTKNAI